MSDKQDIGVAGEGQPVRSRVAIKSPPPPHNVAQLIQEDVQQQEQAKALLD